MENQNLVELTDGQIKELWGEDLYDVFCEHIDAYGRLTANWHEIIENEIPKWDKNYKENPLFKDTYSRMYSLDYDLLEDETLIIPINQNIIQTNSYTSLAPIIKNNVQSINYQINLKVFHEKFGEGIITDIDGFRIFIDFKEGKKCMHGKFAKLSVIEPIICQS